jgi:signal transduction histidine kinase/CheY-like chemotaxis protein
MIQMMSIPAHAPQGIIATELPVVQQGALQRLLVLSGVPYLSWQIFIIAQAPTKLYEVHGIGLLAVLILHLLAFFASKTSLVLAQLCWQASVVAALGVLQTVYHFPLVLFLLTALPFIAMVLTGWVSAVASTALITGAGYWLAQSAGGDLAGIVPWLAVGGAVMAGAGWVTIASFVALLQWSAGSYERMSREVEMARDERLELKQVQEDLVQANKEMARLTKQLKYSNEMAEHARRVKEEFVAAVSHELRTPLNMIIGFSEVITDSPRVYGAHLPPALLADVASIQRNSQHLLELVNDVLDLSQVDSDSMAISHAWNSLTALVNEAIANVGALFTSKGLYLRTELPDDDLSTFCDGTRVREVIINLLSNAGRFTERGGVVVKTWTQDGERIVWVQDTGPGIAAEDQKRIFEPFQQLDSTIRRRYGGSGLGLTISKRFIEMHGGRMWVESQTGGGTTFFFALPIHLMARPAEQESGAVRWFNAYQEYIPRSRRYGAPAPVAVPRFVVLDEHDLLPHIMKRYLLQGLEVTAVHTFEEVCEEINQSPVQAVLVNGPSPDVANRILSQCPLMYGTPIITCWIPGNQDYAEQLGVARYLVKPISREMLTAELDGLGTQIRDVLIVDDNPEALQLFGRMLQSADRSYRTIRAMNGRQALELLRARKPDVMILDLIMPETSGFEVLEEKLKDETIRDIPVLVVSSRDPSGSPIVCNRLTVLREGDFSMQDLIDCIVTVSDTLSLRTWNDAPALQ